MYTLDFMEPRFVVNPVPVEAQRTATVNYVGGSLTATRGLFAQIFKGGQAISPCEPMLQERSVKGYQRTYEVGSPTTTVEPYEYQLTKYPYQVKGQAAGGEPIQIRVNGEWWTARLSGNHTNLDTFLCGQDNAGNITGYISWKSERGSYHGPFGSQSAGD